MATVMFYDGCGIRGDADEIRAALSGAGHDVSLHRDPVTAIESLIAARPDVLVFSLRGGSPCDLYVLRVARRALPEALLLVIAKEASLTIRSSVQPLRPTWYSVSPVDSSELCEVIRVAMPRRAAVARSQALRH